MTKKPIIFISGAFRGKPNIEWNRQQNIRAAEAAALEVWRLGGIAICPHKNTEHFDGAAPDDVWLDGDLQILARCDAILLIGHWWDSKGATREQAFAITHNIEILQNLQEVKKCLSDYKKKNLDHTKFLPRSTSSEWQPRRER
jgi:hypothetical protein